LGAGRHARLGYNAHLEGILDEVRVWNYPRTDEDIQHYMKTRLRGDEAGLVGYWNFDGDRRQSAAWDRSLYHNHGAIWGDALLISTTPF
jgi:hypothetical protein